MKRQSEGHCRRIRRPAMAWAPAPPCGAATDLGRLGAQSYSFRNFDLAGTFRCMKELGLPLIEYCAVHVPPDAAHPDFPHVNQAIRSAGLSVPCFGVEGFTADAAANRKKFVFAKALGATILTADPEPDAFDSLDALCEEFQIKIAIHNHGPGARYDKARNTLDAVKGRHPFIGACVDTGHSIRSGEAPHEVIEILGDRVHSLHLKDWIHGGEEQIVGEGDLDLARVVNALNAIHFSGPIIMEYELSPDNPLPDMIKGAENWRKAAGLR